MLLNDFYTIQTFELEDQLLKASIQINKDHQIFQGHFPGNPVTPGVCMMQIIKELVEKATERSLFMQSSSNVKFMEIINPEQTPDLDLEIQLSYVDQAVQIKNITKAKDSTVLKLNARYIDTP